MKKFSENSINKTCNYAIRIGLYLCLFTPLLFWKTFMYPFITLKVVVFQVLVEIILLLWLILMFKNNLLGKKLNFNFKEFFKLNLKNALLLLIAVLFIASVFGLDFQRSFFSTSERGLGLFALLHFFVFFLILSDFVKRKILDWRKYLLASFLISLVMAGLAFYQLENPSFFFVSSGERPGATLGNPIFLASYLLFNVFIGFLLLKERFQFKKSNLKTVIFQYISIIFLCISVLFLIYSIFLTETRGAILGLYIGFLFLLLYFSVFSFKKRDKIVSIAFLILFLASSIYFWQTKNNSFWRKIPGVRRIATTSLKGSSTLPRLLSWQSALKAARERPILGWGFENYRYAFDKHFEPKLLKFGLAEAFWDKPHNIFLEYLIDGGLLGLLAYLWIFILAFWILYRDKKTISPFLGASFISYFLCNTFNFDTFGSYLMLFMILGVIDSNFKESQQSAEVQLLKRRQNFQILPSVITLLLSIVIFYALYFNFSTLYFNKRCYWSLDYFANKMPKLGLSEFKIALYPFYPYINETRWNFALVVKKTASKDTLPEPKKNISWAVDEMEKAVKSKPESYFLNLSLADLASSFYQFDPNFLEIADRAVKKALALSPSRAEPFLYAAKIAFLKGEKEKAYEYVKKSAKLKPEAAENHFYLGLTALKIGKTEEGFRELAIAKKKGRDSQRFIESKTIADYFADAKEFKKAVNYYNRALAQTSKDSEKAEVKLKLGIVFILKKQTEKGLKFINEAVNLYPEIRNSQFYSQVKNALGF